MSAPSKSTSCRRPFAPRTIACAMDFPPFAIHSRLGCRCANGDEVGTRMNDEAALRGQAAQDQGAVRRGRNSRRESRDRRRGGADPQAAAGRGEAREADRDPCQPARSVVAPDVRCAVPALWPYRYPRLRRQSVIVRPGVMAVDQLELSEAAARSLSSRLSSRLQYTMFARCDVRHPRRIVMSVDCTDASKRKLNRSANCHVCGSLRNRDPGVRSGAPRQILQAGTVEPAGCNPGGGRDS